MRQATRRFDAFWSAGGFDDDGDILPIDMRREIASAFAEGREHVVHACRVEIEGEAESSWFAHLPASGRCGYACGGVTTWRDAHDLDEMMALTGVTV